MSKIGYLKSFNNGTYEELHGEIKTLQFQLSIKLIPDNMRTNEKAPDYIVCANTNSGDDIEIGCAWKKRKEQIGDVSFEFLSIMIDDPSLPEPVNVAGFKQENGSWEISWRRRQAKQA